MSSKNFRTLSRGRVNESHLWPGSKWWWTVSGFQPSLLISLHHFHMPYSWLLSAFSFLNFTFFKIIYTIFKGYCLFIVITILSTIFSMQCITSPWHYITGSLNLLISCSCVICLLPFSLWKPLVLCNFEFDCVCLFAFIF